MKRLVLVPKVPGSKAVKDLANALTQKLGYKVWRKRLGAPLRRYQVPFVVGAGTDKLTQFKTFKGAEVAIPEFTTDRAVAVSWLPTPIVCRRLLRASQGDGIVVAETAEAVVHSPLYTRYFKKKKEFRVHVFNGAVIDVQEKRKRNGRVEGEHRIRNLANGYVFCRDGLVEPAGLRELAIKATASLGYKLGAVDVAWNEHHNLLVVFEVNSNPGLQGQTLETYANAIAGWARGLQ